jgi:hypothetical protein
MECCCRPLWVEIISQWKSNHLLLKVCQLLLVESSYHAKPKCRFPMLLRQKSQLTLQMTWMIPATHHKMRNRTLPMMVNNLGRGRHNLLPIATKTRKGHLGALNLPPLAPITFAPCAVNAARQNLGVTFVGGTTP